MGKLKISLGLLVSLFLVFNVFAGECKYCIPKNSNISCDEIEKALKLVNKIRAEVNVPPVEWDCSLSEGSQKWAEKLAKSGQLFHSNPEGKYGENLYMYMSFGMAPNATLKDAIISWYSEKKNFIYGKSGWCKEGTVCGHYTQLIWKDTKKIGCGKAVNGNEIYIVCRFYPAGNWIGKQPY